jgi:hypothetical protein
VLLKTPLQNSGTIQIGDILTITSSGLDDLTAQTETPAMVGVAVQTPVAATLVVCQLTAPAFQE